MNITSGGEPNRQGCLFAASVLYKWQCLSLLSCDWLTLCLTSHHQPCWMQLATASVKAPVQSISERCCFLVFRAVMSVNRLSQLPPCDSPLLFFVGCNILNWYPITVRIQFCTVCHHDLKVIKLFVTPVLRFLLPHTAFCGRNALDGHSAS